MFLIGKNDSYALRACVRACACVYLSVCEVTATHSDTIKN